MGRNRKWIHCTGSIGADGKWHNFSLYSVWNSMINRCSNIHNKDYRHYGGRGITVCKEWLSYDNFYEWAMANGYADTLTIDRKDVDGNYEPSNCRWITQAEQVRNKRTNIVICGKCIAEIAEITGISPYTLISRYHSNPNIVYEDLVKPVSRR